MMAPHSYSYQFDKSFDSEMAGEKGETQGEWQNTSSTNEIGMSARAR